MSCLREEDDPYVVEEPSDEERALSSSEDEVDVLLHGTPDQKRKLIRECLTGESESSSDDEFQKEMEAELNTTMRTMQGKWKSPEMVALKIWSSFLKKGMAYGRLKSPISWGKEVRKNINLFFPYLLIIVNQIIKLY